jgi:hypothetical protein
MLESARTAGNHHAQHCVTEPRSNAGGLRWSAGLALIEEIEVALRGMDRTDAELRKTYAGSGRLRLGEIDGDAFRYRPDPS